jgi:molecular chaperone GrpE
MTTLAQEVRVQGRLFKQLNEMLIESAQSSGTPSNGTPAAEAGGGGEARSEATGSGQPRKQEIDVLLDLRDRVERGIATARDAAAELTPARLPRFARWLGGDGYARHAQEILSALSHGYSLTLDRLDEALVGCGVDRIACLNRVFDPQRMTAIDIDETAAVPEGTVVEVYRAGYEWNGKVYRAAQVKVARKMGSQLQ